ncbi:MAG: hypothetical protein V4461_13100 [Pseudomonadota bacterium]
MRQAALTRTMAVARSAINLFRIAIIAIGVALIIALIGILVVRMVTGPALAQSSDVRAARQRELNEMLTPRMPRKYVEVLRNSCASGNAPQALGRERTAGISATPDPADACVTALTRLGRDGVLGFVRDPRHTGTTPALAFDNGFVSAYLKREAISPQLPTMTVLKPIAERCLAQAETNIELCNAAGYGFGARAVHGQTVRIP